MSVYVRHVCARTQSKTSQTRHKVGKKALQRNAVARRPVVRRGDAKECEQGVAEVGEGGMEVDQVRRIHQHTPVQHIWTLIVPATFTIKYGGKWPPAREIYGLERQRCNARTDKDKGGRAAASLDYAYVTATLTVHT